MADPLFEQYADDSNSDADEPDRHRFFTTLVLLLLVLALLTTLVWPLIRHRTSRYIYPPTPTPFFLQEA